MKFVHIADMHFDSPFVNLSDKESLGDLRRLDQRKAFKKVIEYIKENKIKYLFISGDLYEQKYIKKSTIEYINNLFKEIGNTKIFIAPGNHDPILKKSYYSTFNWSKNVKIFGPKLEKIETDEADIYGYGFDDFYCSNCGIDDFEIENKEKTNILIIHGTVDGSTAEEMQYNSMSKKMLENKGFDYIALGHIHKPQAMGREMVRYAGSILKYSFSEIHMDKKATILTIDAKKEISLSFHPLKPLRDMREIECSLEELLKKQCEIGNQEDYMHVIITDEEQILDAIGKVRTIYPNVMQISFKNRRLMKQLESAQIKEDQISDQSPAELFEQFYKMQIHIDLDEKRLQLVLSVFEEVIR